ncbi:MAG: DUF4236 domain-containing protein [Clostridiaceae bacterium]|nr:DUF4236 domain-containing protein [Clostridiaceae bacterium]
MGLRVRKSIKICKGVRVNFGKTGASISFGTRGLRHTIHTSGRRTSSIGIPGTGISYVKTNNTRSSVSNRYQTQAKSNQAHENLLEVERYNETVDNLRSIHENCDDYIDWEGISAVKEPFSPGRIGPKEVRALEELNNYTPTFFEKLIHGDRRRELEEAVKKARNEDLEDYKNWETLNLLARRVLAGDTDADFNVIYEMNPLNDLIEYVSDFEFGTNNADEMHVEFTVNTGIVPTYSLSLTKTGKVSRKELTKTAYYDLVQDYVSSCSIRVARDIFALLPVNKVFVHAVEKRLDTQTGHFQDVTVLSVLFTRDILEKLNFGLIDPSDALNNFKHNMKFAKTTGFKPVDRIE